MTQPPTQEQVERIVAGLSEAQRLMVVASEPGGWGRPDTATGAEVIGAGGHSVARSLVAKGLGDIETDPGSYPPALYFHNELGLAVRAHLITKGSDQ